MSTGVAYRSAASVSIKALWRPLLAVIGLTLVTAFIFIQPWPLGEPPSWVGDTFQHAALAESAGWLGDPGTIEQMGSPYGVDWSSLPTGGERVHMVVLGALTRATSNVWVAGNVHLLLVLVMTAVISFLVVRWVGASDLISVGAALSFAFIPAVYDHIAYGHPFLVGLYPIPLAVYLALRWTAVNDRPAPIVLSSGTNGRSPRNWTMPGYLAGSVVAVLLIALSSTYYTVFAAMLVASMGLLLALRRRDWHPLVGPFAVSVALVVVLAVSSLPQLLGDRSTSGSGRKLSDSLDYALRPMEMFLPQKGHPIGLLAGLGSSSTVAIGLLGTVGVALLVWHLISRIGRPTVPADRVPDRLAAIALLSVAIGVAGGLGWLTARFFFGDLRVWSRISSFVAFCGIAWLAAVVSPRRSDVEARSGSYSVEGASVPELDRDRDRRLIARYSTSMVVVAMVVLLALFDQRGPMPASDAVRADMNEDAALVAQLEASLPTNARVLEWPAVSFPDHFSSERLLVPALLSDQLQFTAGAFRGSPGDWQQSWATEEVDQQVTAAAAAGFDALLIQVDHHLWTDPEALIASVRSVAGGPAGESSAATWQWYDLSDVRADLATRHTSDELESFSRSALRPVGVSVSGTPGFPSMGSERDAAVGALAAIELRSYDEDTSSVLVAFEVAAAGEAVVTIDSGTDHMTVTPGPAGERVVVRADLDGGNAEVELSIDGVPLEHAEGKEPVFAQLRHLQVFDADLAESPVLVPAELR